MKKYKIPGPREVRRLAEKKEDENNDFRIFLKGCDTSYDEMDAVAKRVYREIKEQFDCKLCGNCCKESGPVIETGDIPKISKALGMTESEMIKEYLQREYDYGEYEIKKLPCFLLDPSTNTCKLQEKDKPKGCREFPYFEKGKIAFKTISLMGNCYFCPISYTVFEELKVLLGFQ
ncbi:MAG: YkgJ family cysteine cluster protein [Candidatus Hodarchaeota archaeon]